MNVEDLDSAVVHISTDDKNQSVTSVVLGICRFGD